MKKLSLLIGILAIACTTAFAQITKEQNIAEWTRAKAYTKAYLDAMPADGYAFKPTPEVRSFAQQMLHLAGANYMFTATATGKPVPAAADAEKSVPQTKEAVTKAVLDSYDYAIAALQGVPADQMTKEMSLFNNKSTIGLSFAKAFEHQTHHRGQTTPYMRLKGVTPPNEMLF